LAVFLILQQLFWGSDHTNDPKHKHSLWN